MKVWTKRVMTVGAGQITSFAARFIRNIILARLLLPDEFGTAVAINSVIGLAVATDLGLDRFVMVRGTEKSLSAAHFLSIARGLLTALALIALAPQAAALFGVPHASKSFAIAAGISALEALHHLGIRQIWRNYEYGPHATAQIAASVAAIAILYPAIGILHDHRAIIVSLGTEALVYVIISHFLAGSSYRFGFDKHELREGLLFSLPLMLNGVGLALVQQLDRFMVGYWFGVTELALYAVLLSLSAMPGSFILGVFSNIGLSFLISDKNKSLDEQQRYEVISVLYYFVSVSYLLFIIVSLDILAPAIFGRSFMPSPFAQGCLAIIGYLRLVRGAAPTTLLLARSQTRQLALLNLSAIFGLLIAAAGVWMRPELESLLAGLALGEIISVYLFLSVTKKSLKSHNIVKDFLVMLFVPCLIIGAYAWLHKLTVLERGSLLIFGVVAIGAQLAYAILRDKAIQNLLVSATAARSKAPEIAVSNPKQP
jgi:O-antigen/teichoic acid export membrane protein